MQASEEQLEGSEEPVSEHNEIQEGTEEAPEMAIDFEKLQQINPDIVAWIRIESVEIDYPVVQGTDNEFYLHHTFKGNESIAGSIFMDYRNQKDFSDEKVIIYGHNMRDGSMFAKLKKLEIEDKAKVMIYIPEQTLKYKLV